MNDNNNDLVSGLEQPPISPPSNSNQVVVSSLPPMIPSLQNIVATVTLGCPLDLVRIATSTRNTEYSPQRFAAVIMRLREPRCTALIFSSGKMVCTGGHNEAEAKLAARKFARIISKLGFPVSFSEYSIQNMVASTGVNFPIRLEGLAYEHSEFCSYEPELFPGLIYRMLNPAVVILIFVTGKVVITGAKNQDDIRTAFINIYPVLLQFRKGSNIHTLSSIDNFSSNNLNNDPYSLSFPILPP